MNTFSISAESLRAVLPHHSRKKERPKLGVVHVRPGGILEATSGITAARYANAHDYVGETGVSMPVRESAPLHKLLKSAMAKSNRSDVPVVCEEGENGMWTARFAGTAVTFEADDEKFVELDRVIPGEAQMEIARSFGEKVEAGSVDVAHFALFRSADPTGRVTVTFTGRIALVTSPDSNFRGAIAELRR